MSITPLVSIIIPVYNIDKKLVNNCIKSVLAQTYKNIELILVDDGSNKELGKFCDDYEQIEARIRVLHQKNQGVSSARNNGTKQAKGKFIMYVDADDILSPNAISDGIIQILKYNADMVIGLEQAINNYGEFSVNTQIYKVLLLSNKKEFDLLRQICFNALPLKLKTFSHNGYIGRGPSSKLIKKEIALQNLFPVGIAIGEDVIWCLRILNCCKKICIIDSVWYGYIQYSTSTIRKYYGNREELARKYLFLMENENIEFCEKNPYLKGRNIAIEFYSILNYDLLSEQCSYSIKDKNKFAKEIVTREPWNFIIKKDIKRSLPISYQLLILCVQKEIWIQFLNTKNIIKNIISWRKSILDEL